MEPLNLSVNDSVGSYMFTGFIGGTWKPLARITCYYTGDGNTQAGQILFQTANGGDPATQMSISPTGVTNFSGDVNYNLVQGSMYLENGAYTPSMPLKNVFYKLSPGMTVSSSNGITVVPDSITVLTSGSYKIDFVIDMQGSNGNDFRIKMFRNHDPAGVAGSATITTLGAGNKVCLSYFYFINVVAGDVLSFWVTNLSNNTNSCTINDMKVYIEKKPQH